MRGAGSVIRLCLITGIGLNVRLGLGFVEDAGLTMRSSAHPPRLFCMGFNDGIVRTMLV